MPFAITWGLIREADGDGSGTLEKVLQDPGFHSVRVGMESKGVIGSFEPRLNSGLHRNSANDLNFDSGHGIKAVAAVPPYPVIVAPCPGC